MKTTKYTGKDQLVKRLTAQVGSKPLAENILKKRGDMKKDGSYTKAGEARDNMTASQRAKDRASKSSKTKAKPQDYKYDVKTNSATLKAKGKKNGN